MRIFRGLKKSKRNIEVGQHDADQSSKYISFFEKNLNNTESKHNYIVDDLQFMQEKLVEKMKVCSNLIMLLSRKRVNNALHMEIIWALNEFISNALNQQSKNNQNKDKIWLAIKIRDGEHLLSKVLLTMKKAQKPMSSRVRLNTWRNRNV